MTDLATLQATLIHLHAMDEERKRLDARIAKLKTDMRLAEVSALVIMQELGLDALSHAGLLAKRKNVVHFKPVSGDGWDRIYARILRTQEWELIQKRLSSTAVRERFKAGDVIDGIEQVEVPELDVTLVGGDR